MRDLRRADNGSSLFANRWIVSALPPILVFLLMVCLWQWTVEFWKLKPIVLPSPAAVWKAATEKESVLIKGMLATGAAAGLGLVSSVVIGSILAILFSQFRWLRLSIYPYVIFLQTVPIVAIAPLLIIWSGNNLRTIVIIATIISVFPIIANVTAGLLAIDRNWIDLFQMHWASRWQSLAKLRIPAAIPHLLVGMRISSGLAVIGAIIGEFFVGNATSYDGLGSLMTQWQSQQRTAHLFAALVASTLLGIAFFLIVHLLGRTVFRRWTMAVDLESYDP